MAKKRRSNHQEEIEALSLALVQNGKAIETGTKKKHWSKHDIKPITPITSTQADMFLSWENQKHICAYGSAGTGKSFLSLFLAINEVLEKNQRKIIVIRSAVSTREIGFLPGTVEEKTALYELPYHSIMHELVGRKSTYQDMKDAGLIEFVTTSFIRGLTWDNAIIIVDEGENLTMHEIDSVMTRVGKNTRIIFNGDMKQTDLDGSKKNGVSGMAQALTIFDKMNAFDTIQFTTDDIVRSEFVKEWIIASEKLS